VNIYRRGPVYERFRGLCLKQHIQSQLQWSDVIHFDRKYCYVMLSRNSRIILWTRF